MLLSLTQELALLLIPELVWWKEGTDLLMLCPDLYMCTIAHACIHTILIHKICKCENVRELVRGTTDVET